MNRIDGDTAIGRYLRAIGNMPLLTQKETLELVARIKKGDKEAREKLINSNLKLVVYLAKRYVGRSDLTFWDLIQEGNYGLVEAVEGNGFDGKKSYQFSTYAGRAINNAIITAVYDCSRAIRIPAYMQARIRNIFRAENCLWQENGSQASFLDLIDKISKGVGLTKGEVREALRYCYKFISLQQPVRSGGQDALEEFIDEGGNLTKFSRNFESGFNPEVYRKLDQEGLRKIFNDALKILSPKEKLVIGLSLGLNGKQRWTFVKIGRKLGVTRECVRQIKERALGKLRRFPQIKCLVKQ